MLLQKMAEKQRKNEGKRCNLTVLWEKSFVSSETWKFAERDDIWRHPYFPAKFARVAKCKVERSLMWTVETRAAMTWFPLLLECQLKRAIRQGIVQQNSQFG